MARRNGTIIAQGAALYRTGQYGLLLDALLAAVECAQIVREARLVPGRKWRADVAWPAHRVAMELQGAVHTRGHHVRGRGYEDDCEKILLATAAGWRVLPLTWPMIAHQRQEIAAALNEILHCTNPHHHRKG